MIENVFKGKRNLPPRILLYGTEGIGKSTFGASMPDPIFIQTENGLDNIHTSSFPLAKTLDDVKLQLNALITEQHTFKTMVIDSLDWLERLVFDDVCKTFGVKCIEKADGGYGKGYEHAANTWWKEILPRLNTIRETRNMIVLLIAHTRVEKYSDPELVTDRFTPKLHKLSNAMLCEWCDMILLATRENGATLGATGGGRILRTVTSQACVSKNRYSLPEILPLSWVELRKAIEVQKQKEGK